MGCLEMPRATQTGDHLPTIHEVGMIRVRSLGLPATSKARIVKSLYSVGFYGAEVGGMSATHMNAVLISARKALGKGANLRRSSPRAYGQGLWRTGRRSAGTLDWPLEPNVWDNALDKDYKVKYGRCHKTARFCWPGFLETGLSSQSYRHLKKSISKVDDSTCSAVNAASDMKFGSSVCVVVKKRRIFLTSSSAALNYQLADDDDTPACVRLHGLQALRWSTVLGLEVFGLMGRRFTVARSDPQHRRCGVGYYTDTKRLGCLFLDSRSRCTMLSSLLSSGNANRMKCFKWLATATSNRTPSRRHPKGRNRDLEKRVLQALLLGQRIRWMKAHLKQTD
eukprot:806159-Amphidinium_carterae.2